MMSLHLKCLLAGTLACGWLAVSAQDSATVSARQGSMPSQGVLDAGRTAPRTQESNSRTQRARAGKGEAQTLEMETVVSAFSDYLEGTPFLSAAAVEREAAEIDEHVDNLRNRKDRDDYMRKHQLDSCVKAVGDSIAEYRNNVTSLVAKFLRVRVGNKTIDREDECIKHIEDMVDERLDQREKNLQRLKTEMGNSQATVDTAWRQTPDWRLVGIGVCLLLMVALLAVWYWKASRKSSYGGAMPAPAMPLAEGETALVSQDESTTPPIVVRRRTRIVLHTRSLDDVIDNDAYKQIDCSDFCADSAVRRMYIKNTCIKDIYNMYAEDLRNPDNPKEDGCMVLGRWVCDDQTNEYYVSLEQIVWPGDDAVFSEYELNFGGKIMLKKNEQLRRLRKETDLQYDLTCWVHSHPGLGVFFSNADCNVQMQLKHPLFPNFLTAIVVDILTPQQEFGIFTFKRDLTLNSKADLTRLYSLEELYQWAVESERNTFKKEDYYDTLAEAKTHTDRCSGICLSNGAIIDMAQYATEERTNFVALVHGYVHQHGVKTDYAAVKVSRQESVPDTEALGCFVMTDHCSIPTVRKLVAAHLEKISFVLVYTSSDGLLTSIPVVDHDVCSDAGCYGEHKLEDLKIWTRRKR